MYKKTVLDDGVRIVTDREEHSRLVAVGIWVDVGSRDEHDLNSGCAHFVEHMFFKGTASRTPQQIAKELDGLGGTANAFTAKETTCFYATVLDRQLEAAVDLLADMFFDSLFLQEEVVRERQVILQEIGMVEDTPDDHIHDLFAALLWGNHPLGKSILGSREVVAAMDAAKLLDYINRLYIPERVLIAAAGNVDHDEFVRLWERKLATAPAFRARRGRSMPLRQRPGRTKAQRAVYSRDLEQVHLMLGTYGVAADAPERYAFLLLNVLLGGNMSSRLFQEIREKRGLAYSVYSYINSYLDCGNLAIYLGVDPETLNESLALVLKETGRLRHEAIPEEELANAKDFVTAGLYLSAENMEAIMTRIARNEMTFGRDISLEEMVVEVEGVKGEEISGLAESLFGGRELTVGALGPIDADEIDWSSLG